MRLFYAKRNRFSNWRGKFLIFIILAFASIIFLRLFSIQILKYEFYRALAQNQQQTQQPLFPKRGEIFIQEKHSKTVFPLVVNRDLATVYAVPLQIKDKRKLAENLAPLLDISGEELFKKLNKPNDYYEILKRRIIDETTEQIKALKLEGIYFTQESWRYWPEGNLASHLLGFVGYKEEEQIGQYGIEGYYDSILRGESGSIKQHQDPAGRWIPVGERDFKPAKNGANLILTIDRVIQYFTEQKLQEYAEKFQIDAATVIVMDPKTGAILALANWPSFDPNKYYKEKDYSIFLNRAIQTLYEPGSAFKPITMAIGLSTGKIRPNTTYEDKGVVLIDGYPIRNFDFKAYGTRTMIEVLENSLNTGAIFVAEQVGKELFLKYVKDFGFNVPTGVGLDGEISGDLTNLEKNRRDVEYATASFGQGISVTPMELITAISSFANDGKLMQPYIVQKIIYPDGSEKNFSPKIINQVVTPKTATEISAMMVSVIENGHAKRAYIPGYHLAGKTGTAQVPESDKRGYSDKTIHSFLGFGPIPDPRFSILVKLDNPKGVQFAEASAGPLWREIMQYLLNYYQIPPNER